MNGRKLLIYYSIKYEGNWEKIFSAIKEKEKVQDEEIELALQSIKSKVVTLVDDDYPEIFKTIYKPPFVVYYYGDLSLTNSHFNNVSIVGTRKVSDYGKEMTRKIAIELAKEKVIVSGLALGVDAIAHESALEADGKTIAILGSGIDYAYPISNKKLYERIKNSNNLILSEYPNSMSPKHDNFPFRNRLIACLSEATLVTEAYNYSGTLITVAYALSFGRDVMCVPHKATSESVCNNLIKEGASLVESAQDVLNQLSYHQDKNK